MTEKTTGRNTSGATFALVAACLVILALIGIAFAFISLQVGGKRQTEHAVQAGSLSLMHAVCKITVPVSTLTLAQQNIVNGAFQGKPPSGIDLINYNQLIGYAMVQAQNAVDDKGGEGGQEYASAQKIIDAIQNDPDSIGQRLVKAINNKLADSSFVETNFAAVANANPLGLFAGGSKKGQVKLQSCMPVFVNQFGSSSSPISNVSIDLNNSDYSGLAEWAKGGPDSSHTNSDKQPFTFVSGYTAISPKIVGSNSGGNATPYKALYAISINPNEPVHMVAANAVTMPHSTNASSGSAPPFNGLQILAGMLASDGSVSNRSEVFVVAGGQTVGESPIVPPSIPGGYIVIKNEKALEFPGNIDIVNVASAPENNELMTGVYLTGTKNGYPLFTTDANAFPAWAAYNAAVKLGQPATKPQLNSSAPIFNPGGAIATENELLAIRYVNSKAQTLGIGYGSGKICSECFWNSFSGKTAMAPCQNLRGSFTAAYGVPNTVSSFRATNALSAEAAKAAFLHAYGYLTQHFAEVVAEQQKHVQSATKFVNVPGSTLFGAQGEDDWITVTTTSYTWDKSGTALTLSATGNVGECINNIGASPDNDVMVGVSGLQKFPHNTVLYASGTDGSGEFLPFINTVAQAPTNPANVKSVKVSQDGTLLDYMSEISAFMPAGKVGPVKNLIGPMTTDYPFCTITTSTKGVATVKPTKNLMTEANFVKALKTQMSSKTGKVGSFIKAMHQIVPNKDPNQFGIEVYQILTGPTIPMGQTMYIYADQNNKDPQGLPKLIFTKTAPGASATQTPNGGPQIFHSTYAVLGTTINPPKEMAITDSLFTQMLKGITASTKRVGQLKGVDEAKWTPNTSSNNFLGELNFASGLTGITESEFDVILSLTSQTTTKTVVAQPN